MDALALLCHLSADGTSTLVRLRQAGYATLQDVLLGDADELVELLDASPRTIERLLRRAEELEDRMGDAALESDRSPALSAPAPPPAAAPGRHRNPLPCTLEVGPLEEEPEAAAHLVSAPAAPAESRRAPALPPGIPLPRPTTPSAPAATRPRLRHGASRFWTPIRRDPESTDDPGSPGPFA